MRKLNRREFIGTAVAVTGTCAAGAALVESKVAPKASGEALPAFSIDRSIKSPTDKVSLGKSNLKVSLVGIGTGSIGYAHQSRQTRLGQEAFTRLIHHSLDQGINFFDLADSYGSHTFFREAVKGVPREQYVVQTKTDNRDPRQAREDIDRFLNEVETDYIDSLIIHCVTEADWTTRHRGVMDVFEEAKQKGKIRSCGVTCHSFEALKAAEASDWVQINQIRWNPHGAHMDGEVEEMRALFKRMRAKNQGMIGMKVVGQGDIIGNRKSLTPEHCFRFQIESGVVDAFVVGVESVGHIDQMLRGTQAALKEFGYRTVSTV